MNMFHRCAVYPLLALSIIISGAVSLYAEAFFLKDGSIIEGKVLSETDDGVTIITPGKLKTEISRDLIIRKATGDSFKKPVYILKKDGGVIKGYIVEEGSEGIMVRKELASPDELKILKGDVVRVSSEKIEAPSSVKRDPWNAALVSLIPIRSGSMAAGPSPPGTGFIIVKTCSLLLPLAMILGPAAGVGNSEDGSTGRLDITKSDKARSLLIGSLAVWAIATGADMIYSYYHVRNYNERKNIVKGNDGSIYFSIIPIFSAYGHGYAHSSGWEGFYLSGNIRF